MDCSDCFDRPESGPSQVKKRKKASLCYDGQGMNYCFEKLSLTAHIKKRVSRYGMTHVQANHYQISFMIVIVDYQPCAGKVCVFAPVEPSYVMLQSLVNPAFVPVLLGDAVTVTV